MIARIRNVLFFAFMRRLDRRLLLRAPMLWRTRLLHLLVLLILAVIATVPFVQASINDPSEILLIGTDTVLSWRLRLYVAVGVIVLWILSIIRRPVGELVPHRHVVTVVAVAMGSYLWLVTPSLLAYPQIDAIKRIGPSDQVLNTDLNFLYQYGLWSCVPPHVWDDASKLEQLRDVLARYGYEGKPTKGKSVSWCTEDGVFELEQSSLAYNSRRTIETISHARKFGSSDYNEENQFYGILIGHSWWLAAALGIGILTTILSYPAYVWRRTFLRR
jgi:hypothetical protein